jgi:hypothetical protein
MTSVPSSGVWNGKASTSTLPPASYWAHLAVTMPVLLVDALQKKSDLRLNEFNSVDLPLPRAGATALLERVANDGWLERRQRPRCPACKEVLSDEETAESACPRCNEPFSDHGGVSFEIIYVRKLSQGRDVDWVVAIHGMNTRGAWQEAFNWHFSTTWGQAVPVEIYKYGLVISGVIMFWRRRKLRNNLRQKLAVRFDEANRQGLAGKPDVIAHSFGTWLFGHLLEKELKRSPEERLKFGRIILTGCVLRPDFAWKSFKDAGLVDDVLNHCGTKDPVVPMAHATILDSGPSGRRGFDGNQIINVRAVGFGHSDLFSIEKFVVNGKFFQKPTGAAGEMNHLEYAYNRYWKPFLTLPGAELDALPDRFASAKKWWQLPWPLRGTIFPVLVLPLLFSLVMFGLACLGLEIWATREIFKAVIKYCAAGLASLLVCIGLVALGRRWRS